MTDMETMVSLGTNRGIIGEMTTGKVVDQQFVATLGCLERVGLRVGTYRRKNIGNTLEMQVLDEDMNVAFSAIVNPRTFYDSRMNSVEVGCPVDKGRIHTLRLKSLSGAKGRSITFMRGDCSERLRLSINESEVGGALCCTLTFSDRRTEGAPPRPVGGVPEGTILEYDDGRKRQRKRATRT